MLPTRERGRLLNPNHVILQSEIRIDILLREWFRALDCGFAHYTVVLLGCTDGDGNVFVVDEHAERMWLLQRHAAAVKAVLGRRGLVMEQLRRFVAGADVFSRQADGTTIAQQYLREGIKLRPANMDRINGWAEILQLFGEPNVGLAQGGEYPAEVIHSSEVWAVGRDVAGDAAGSASAGGCVEGGL
jgi:hypothetical protein